MTRHILALSLATALATTSACTSPGKKTAIGAGAGAATGAIIGGATKGAKGAVIGGAVGAAAGGAVGNILDKQAKELKKVAEDTQRTKDGILVKLKNDLLFETGSAMLKPAAVEDLTKLGDIIAKYPEDRIKVLGHTDDVGTKLFNEELSQRRADAVREVLQSQGVKPEQMIVLGMGETSPAVPAKTSQARSKNRRVELMIDIPQQQTG